MAEGSPHSRETALDINSAYEGTDLRLQTAFAYTEGLLRLVGDEAETPLLEERVRVLLDGLLRLITIYHEHKRCQLLEGVEAAREDAVRVWPTPSQCRTRSGRLDQDLPEPALP